MDLGSVKVDLHGKEMFYKDLTLSDESVLQLLIEYRYKYDTYLHNETNYVFSEAGDVAHVNQELIALYASIDQLIKQCKFSNEQLKIIKRFEHGYTMQEMADSLGLGTASNARRRFKSIIKKMVSTNEWNWRKTVYYHTIGLKNKQCSKCREVLPATNEFFTGKNDSSDGYHPYCRECKK